MDFLTVLRSINLVLWLGVFFYMVPSPVAVLRGSAHRGDPARTVYAGFAGLMILFTSRWLFFPHNDEAFGAIYVFSAVWAVLTVGTARSYGRGNRL